MFLIKADIKNTFLPPKQKYKEHTNIFIILCNLINSIKLTIIK